MTLNFDMLKTFGCAGLILPRTALDFWYVKLQVSMMKATKNHALIFNNPVVWIFLPKAVKELKIKKIQKTTLSQFSPKRLQTFSSNFHNH